MPENADGPKPEKLSPLQRLLFGLNLQLAEVGLKGADGLDTLRAQLDQVTSREVHDGSGVNSPPGIPAKKSVQ